MGGRRLKLMPVVDEYARQCHTIEVERSIRFEAGVSTLRHLFQVHGAPEFIRSDNGPEFIAKAVKEWLACSGVKTLVYRTGQPVAERVRGKLQWQARRRAAAAGGLYQPR